MLERGKEQGVGDKQGKSVSACWSGLRGTCRRHMAGGPGWARRQAEEQRYRGAAEALQRTLQAAWPWRRGAVACERWTWRAGPGERWPRDLLQSWPWPGGGAHHVNPAPAAALLDAPGLAGCSVGGPVALWLSRRWRWRGQRVPGSGLCRSPSIAAWQAGAAPRAPLGCTRLWHQARAASRVERLTLPLPPACKAYRTAGPMSSHCSTPPPARGPSAPRPILALRPSSNRGQLQRRRSRSELGMRLFAPGNCTPPSVLPASSTASYHRR